jgi:FkbM family methyltransferase
MKPIQFSSFNKMLFPKVNVKLINEIELFFINDLIEPGTVVFDIGANEGLYLLLFGQSGRYERVIGFEPIPVLNKRLKAFFPELEIMDFAISDKTQNSQFKIPLINNKRFDTRGTLEDFEEINETGRNTFEVKTISLDDFVTNNKIENLGGIKIDVEGHELKVIRGGENILKKYRPFLMIEIEQRHHATFPIQSIFEEVLSYGYKGFFFDPVKMKFETIDMFDVLIHQSNPRSYINNFLFVNADLDYQTKFVQLENQYKKAYYQ